MSSAINLKKRSIGVNFNAAGQAEINLWAPFAKSVMLLLSDKNKCPLKEASYGYWHLTTAILKPGDTYQFVLDDGKPLPDPASLVQPKGVHEPSQTFDLQSFVWDDKSWQNISLNNYIFYEVHTGAFTTEGTFTSLEAKLDYLKELGITAVELMPVAQFPGNRNWGYDGVFPLPSKIPTAARKH